jgi:predicted dehydrogenase
MSSDVLRAAVIGCGDISGQHVDAILGMAGAELVAVCDPHDARRVAAAERGQCPGVGTLTELLDAVSLDVAHICTPHNRHADLAGECLARGISVLLEKPIAHTVDAAESLVSTCQRSGAILGICMQNRYNEHARRLHELLETGALGAVLGARAAVNWSRDVEYYARRDWRGKWETAGGGVLMNQAIHTVDLLWWFLGPIVDARGVVGTLALPGIEVEDTAALHLRHQTAAGNVVGSVLHATNAHVENSPVVVEVVTEKAWAKLDLDLTVTYRDGRVEVFETSTAASGPRAYWGDSHRLLIDDFYRHVRSGQQFWIDGSAGLESLRAIQSVYEQCLWLRA